MIKEYVGVHLMDFPETVHGFTVMVDVGVYDIFINSKMSHHMQIETYDHEIRHIDNGDFDKMYDVTVLEYMMDERKR